MTSHRKWVDRWNEFIYEVSDSPRQEELYKDKEFVALHGAVMSATTEKERSDAIRRALERAGFNPFPSLSQQINRAIDRICRLVDQLIEAQNRLKELMDKEHEESQAGRDERTEDRG